MKKNIGIIYIFRNKVNEKYYIGQTKQKFKDRLNQHLNEKNNNYFENAYQKNPENFEIIKFIDIPILQITPDKSVLDYFEEELIKRLNTLKPNGYNLETGGNKNKKLSEETKIKISNSLKGKFKGIKLSKEHIEKIRQKNLGRKASKETKEKLKISHLGKKQPIEQTEKIRKANTGKKRKPFSIETKQKMRNARIGKFIGKDHPGARKVICLNNLKVFDTIKEAIIFFHIDRHSISDCCKGLYQFSGKDSNGNKLHWMYYSDYLKLQGVQNA